MRALLSDTNNYLYLKYHVEYLWFNLNFYYGFVYLKLYNSIKVMRYNVWKFNKKYTFIIHCIIYNFISGAIGDLFVS